MRVRVLWACRTRAGRVTSRVLRSGVAWRGVAFTAPGVPGPPQLIAPGKRSWPGGVALVGSAARHGEGMRWGGFHIYFLYFPRPVPLRHATPRHATHFKRTSLLSSFEQCNEVEFCFQLAKVIIAVQGGAARSTASSQSSLSHPSPLLGSR